MVSDQPLSIPRLLSLFEKELDPPERGDIRSALEQLQQDHMDRGIELKEIASGFRFQVRCEYAKWINHLFEERSPRYSRALMETLAIIAYRQPITRGEIEDIRGVSVSSTIIKTILEREWIRVVGHRDIPGKPELLATTKSFLDYFNLKKLTDLPALAEIKDFDTMNPDLFDGIVKEETDEQSELQSGEVVEPAGFPEQDVPANETESDDVEERALSEGSADDDAKVISFSG
jgi:segregation and condensation protein B